MVHIGKKKVFKKKKNSTHVLSDARLRTTAYAMWESTQAF